MTQLDVSVSTPLEAPQLPFAQSSVQTSAALPSPVSNAPTHHTRTLQLCLTTHELFNSVSPHTNSQLTTHELTTHSLSERELVSLCVVYRVGNICAARDCEGQRRNSATPNAQVTTPRCLSLPRWSCLPVVNLYPEATSGMNGLAWYPAHDL